MDIWFIITYVIGVLFNIGAVSVIRLQAISKGQAFLSSGRFAVIAVYVLCFIELLVTGRFEALQDPQKFIILLQTTSTMAIATLGTHIVGRTAIK